jgi:hypothetical protein
MLWYRKHQTQNWSADLIELDGRGGVSLPSSLRQEIQLAFYA